MKRSRQKESSLLLGLADMKVEEDALAAETASRAAAALSHFPGGNSWKKVLQEFAGYAEKPECAYPGIPARILSGSEKCAAHARELAENTDLSSITSPEKAYLLIPGLMLAETAFGTRGRYDPVLKTFQAVSSRCEEMSDSYDERYALLMACAVESMEWMDQAIYEVYRGFEDIFLANARKLSELSGESNGQVSPFSRLLASYAILKACRLGAILTERHAAAAEKEAEKIMKKADDSGQARMYAAAALTYAEGIRNRDYRDYGVKNGGVLWS